MTHSSGNHGQALAWAAQQLKLPCSVVVPENTAAVKINAIKTYGADVVLSPATPQDRYTWTKLNIIIFKTSSSLSIMFCVNTN